MGSKRNILVVGAGLAGSVVARELAERDYKVTVIDKRDHIGGNCYDYQQDGVRIHKYGPHIFHTDNQQVFQWLSRFTEWTEYKHKVKAYYNGQFLTFPPDQRTIDVLGDKLIDVLYKPYTKKMWKTEVDDSVLDRVRGNNTEYYFTSRYQCLPKNGYTKLFENILDHQNIRILLNTPFGKVLESNYHHVFNSMPIDQYYDYCYGRLAYRSIKFHNVKSIEFEMPTSVVNFTDSGKYTRVTKWDMFPDHGSGDLYTLEEPCEYMDNYEERYYPVKDKNGLNRKIYKMYHRIKNDKVTFIGRCGLYAYIDMDMAVSSSLSTVRCFR